MKTIFTHVYHFKLPARIELLTLLLRNEDQIRRSLRKYPLEICGPGYRAVLSMHDSDGFTFEGWTYALWTSLWDETV